MSDMIKESEDEDRRKFLQTCGRFAIVTPPALTMLLSTSLTSNAIARSGGTGDPGGSYHHHDGGGDYQHHWEHHHEEHHRDGWGPRGDRD